MLTFSNYFRQKFNYQVLIKQQHAVSVWWLLYQRDYFVPKGMEPTYHFKFFEEVNSSFMHNKSQESIYHFEISHTVLSLRVKPHLEKTASRVHLLKVFHCKLRCSLHAQVFLANYFRFVFVTVPFYSHLWFSVLNHTWIWCTDKNCVLCAYHLKHVWQKWEVHIRRSEGKLENKPLAYSVGMESWLMLDSPVGFLPCLWLMVQWICKLLTHNLECKNKWRKKKKD